MQAQTFLKQCSRLEGLEQKIQKNYRDRNTALWESRDTAHLLAHENA
jgi:hypothetical protein